MTRNNYSVTLANDPEANDLKDDKPTSSRADTSSPPFDGTRGNDDREFVDDDAEWTGDENEKQNRKRKKAELAKVIIISGLLVIGAINLTINIRNHIRAGKGIDKLTPNPDITITPKIQCPDAGAAMFTGYKISPISEDRQILMVALTGIHERLELFFTNTNIFGLPTMSEEFIGNNTGSVKIIIPSGGFSAGTLFGYKSPAPAISGDLIWQNSAPESGFTLPEQGGDVLLYCRDDFRIKPIASLSYGVSQENIPDDVTKFSIAIPDSSCAFYKGAKLGTAEDLKASLARSKSFDTTQCQKPWFDRDADAMNLPFKVIEPNSKPSMQPSVSYSPSQTPTYSRSEEPSSKSILPTGSASPTIPSPIVTSDPSVSQSPIETPSVKPPSQNQTKRPRSSMRPLLRASAPPTVSVVPS